MAARKTKTRKAAPAKAKTARKAKRAAPLLLDAAKPAGESLRARVLASLRSRTLDVNETAAALGLEPKQVRGCIDGLRRAGVPVRALGKGRFSAR